MVSEVWMNSNMYQGERDSASIPYHDLKRLLSIHTE